MKRPFFSNILRRKIKIEDYKLINGYRIYQNGTIIGKHGKPRSFYKVIDTHKNIEIIFTAASCAARYIGSSAPPIIKYARGERRNQLFKNRYKIEELPFPKGKGISKKQETISIDEYEKLKINA